MSIFKAKAVHNEEKKTGKEICNFFKSRLITLQQNKSLLPHSGQHSQGWVNMGDFFLPIVKSAVLIKLTFKSLPITGIQLECIDSSCL